MNLVAKEYVAAQDPNDPGVLILSRFAGAAEQLTEALVVNPYNVEEMADAIKVALDMNLQERKDRNEALVAAIRTQDTFDWCRTFLNTLESVHDREARSSGGPASDALLEAQDAQQLVPARPRAS
jgi:trehalose 6-phosphate synthase